MTENFKDHPATLTELKANRSSKGTDWTPRDALIQLLREIDNGEKVVTEIVICMDYTSAAWPKGTIGYKAAGPNPNLNFSAGMLFRCLDLLCRPDE